MGTFTEIILNTFVAPALITCVGVCAVLQQHISLQTDIFVKVE